MTHQHQLASAPRGLGLRTQLILGFVVLLAILIAVGVESISLLDRLGGSIDVILRENYKSVIACEQMKEALERMDSGALFALAGEEGEGGTLAAQNRPRFAAALQTELGNITLPGEGARAERLRQLFAAYTPVLEQVLAPQAPAAERRALYFQRLYPTFQQIKETADEILEMNQGNMVQANDRARHLASSASREMALLLLAGTAVAGLCIFLLSNAILGPLERLTRAAGEIEKGNLDLRLPVTSRDELGVLAAAFNSMAHGLRELRETDQARLLRARRISQSALDKLPEAVAVVSGERPERKVELANQAATTLFGLVPDQPIPEPHAEWLSPLLDHLASGRLGAEARVKVTIDGHERFFEPHGMVLRDAQGRMDGMVLVLADVTGGLRGSEVQAGLLANAAHDFELSLGPLRDALESLGGERLGPLTPHQKQRLDAAQAQAARLGEVAAHLLAVSSLGESRQQLHLEPVSPAELVAAAVEETAPGFKEEQVKAVTDVSPEVPRVLADGERARLVLTSLLRNARAHSAPGGVVTVRAEPWQGRVRFSVADTGSGIPSAHLEQIFEPFHQVPGTQDLGGVGMGLAIARSIVLAHGGEIHVESEEGHGATFWFTLPVATD